MENFSVKNIVKILFDAKSNQIMYKGEGDSYKISGDNGIINSNIFNTVNKI